MEEKIATIKTWLGTGSINIFGLPMSGKDTQGVKLAEALGGKFLSSGVIIRAMEEEKKHNYTADGSLLPTDLFYEWVLPYFKRQDLAKFPLILSSIGRWFGEEDQVMTVAAESGHNIKAVVVLNVSEADVEKRYEESKILEDRGDRPDDKNYEIFKNRLKEFRTKTMPVIQHYNALGVLVNVNGDQPRDEVFNEMVDKLYAKALQSRV